MLNSQASWRTTRDLTLDHQCKDTRTWSRALYSYAKLPRADIKRFVNHWRHKFDWRAHERKINELPNYEVQVEVDGHGTVDMHFLHQKSDVPGAIPLLFVHGWPGSFLEVTKMLPLLKGGDGKPAFHVVAPSLP